MYHSLLLLCFFISIVAFLLETSSVMKCPNCSTLLVNTLLPENSCKYHFYLMPCSLSFSPVSLPCIWLLYRIEPVLLYASELWSLTKTRTFEVADMWFLRRMLRIPKKNQ